MANASPNARDPTRPIFHLLALSSRRVYGGSCWVRGALHWVRGSSRWVRKAFKIPTCWYRLALGGLPHVRTQRDSVAVEYRLNSRWYR